MNKNMAGILSAAAVLTMLAGCTAYDRTKDQFVQPCGERRQKRHEPGAGCTNCG